MNNETIKKIIAQTTPIIISGILAAALAFFQSIATNYGVCNTPNANIESTAALGSAIKAGHSAIKFLSNQAMS